MPDSGMFELLAPEYENLTYDIIFPTGEDFKTKIRATGLITETEITDAFLKLLWGMLYAKHGTDPIVSANEGQWVFRVALVTKEYAPTYLKKDAIQKALRALDLEDLREGYKNIFNHATNPSTKPSTDNTEELPYINDQNVNKGKRGKADAYAYLWEILNASLTEDFLKKYDKLFSMVATTTNRAIYYGDN